MARNRKIEELRAPLEGEARSDIANRLKTARGHIEHVIQIVDEGGYAIEVLQQIAAVRGALDATVRSALRYYFEHTFANAVKNGKTEVATKELMRALRFLREAD